MRFSLYIGSKKYALSTEDDILKMYPEEFNCNYKILIGTKNILKDLQKSYIKLFQKSVDKYNKNNFSKEIKSYYCKVNESKKLSLATAILIKIPEKRFKKLELEEKKITEIFLNQLKLIKKIIPNFYIVSAILYYDKSLTLRIIGVPYLKEKDNELEVRVSKSSCFSREKIEELRLRLSIQASSDFLKFFIKKTKIRQETFNINQLTLFQS